MGSCLSGESGSPRGGSPMSLRKRRNSKRRFGSRSSSFDYRRDEQLHRTPGRMFLNGSSDIASLFSQQGKKGTNQDAMIVWEVSSFSLLPLTSDSHIFIHSYDHSCFCQLLFLFFFIFNTNICTLHNTNCSTIHNCVQLESWQRILNLVWHEALATSFCTNIICSLIIDSLSN